METLKQLQKKKQALEAQIEALETEDKMTSKLTSEEFGMLKKMETQLVIGVPETFEVVIRLKAKTSLRIDPESSLQDHWCTLVINEMTVAKGTTDKRLAEDIIDVILEDNDDEYGTQQLKWTTAQAKAYDKLVSEYVKSVKKIATEKSIDSKDLWFAIIDNKSIEDAKRNGY